MPGGCGFECHRQIIPTGETIFGLLCEAAQADCGQRFGNAGQRGRRTREDRLPQPCRVVVREGQSARQHLVQDDAETPDVASSVEWFPFQLFRRTVSQRPPPVAAVDQVFAGPCKAEIADVRLARLVEKDVRWFQVAVDHALAVCVVDHTGDLDQQLRRLLG